MPASKYQARARRLPAAQSEPVQRLPYLKAWPQARARRIGLVSPVSQRMAAGTRKARASGAKGKRNIDSMRSVNRQLETVCKIGNTVGPSLGLGAAFTAKHYII